MGASGMKESDLLQSIRSLLRSDEMSHHRAYLYSGATNSGSTETEATDADADADDSRDEFPVPTDDDDALRDVLIELNVTTHEYIRMALDYHGGRLRQQEIADLTGWSEPTVSQKLGEMEDADLITRFRTGREKIVCLPDDSPVDAVDPDEPTTDEGASSLETAGTRQNPENAPENPDTTPR